MSNESQDNSFTVKKLLFNENGKFCLPCTLYKGFQYMSGSTTTLVAAPIKVEEVTIKQAAPLPIITGNQDLIPGSRTYQKDNPPDVGKLGASSWTFLHAMAAKYPDKPTTVQKNEMSEFLTIFSHVYPCFWCAKDFEKYIQENSPRIQSKEELSRWMCEAHNKVNKKLGKPKFNCDFWKQRWQEGWDEE